MIPTVEALRDVTEPILGYRVPAAEVAKASRFGDALRYRITLEGRSGRRVTKHAMVSGCAQVVLPRYKWRAEMAHQIRKRAKEAARDLVIHEAE